MQIVPSSEFRSRQKYYFEKSRKDGVVYVANNGNIYSLRPTTEIEIYYANPQVQADIEEAKKEMANGETYEAKPEETIDDFLSRMRADGNV